MKTKSLACQLVVRDLVVKVKEKTILNGVNSMAGSGDLLAIMGPTGKNNILHNELKKIIGILVFEIVNINY